MKADPDPDYYGVLGVEPSANASRIQARYRLLAKRYHPDLAPGDEAAASERFRLIRQAYETLGDAKRRAQYDRERLGRLERQAKVASRTAASQDAANLDEISQVTWGQAVQIHPHLEKIRRELFQIAAPLAAIFQVTLLASKEYGQASDVAARLKASYFARYLDKDPHLLHFPDWLHDIRNPDDDDV